MNFKSILLSASALLFTISIASAQMGQMPQQQVSGDDFTDQQIEKFIEASKEVSAIQQEGSMRMQQVIEDTDEIDAQKFQQFFQAQQQQQLDQVDASAEELAAYNQAAQEMMQINQELEKKSIKAIEGQGISTEEYQKMTMAYQQDSKFQEKINSMIEGQ
ncbi:MAG: DUF4168 domain-containing protein [Cyclobacteriaceae bacterium]|nr:DUF4168 domain-containing protein [Cyclobacteriaceae bacterium]MCH8515472.1 DUF4168 domain-containing protein [Cyclobacteriaceae bacterium]